MAWKLMQDYLKFNEYKDLREKDIQYMQQLFEHATAIKKVFLYGSRATGNYETASDIDLAIVGEKISISDIL